MERLSMSEKSMIVTIRKDGTSSYKVTVTEFVKDLGLEVGDQVKITMEKLQL